MSTDTLHLLRGRIADLFMSRPMLSANTGVRTLDLGNAQLSMHSIRETGGAYDVEYAVNLFESFFEHYGELESKIFVD